MQSKINHDKKIDELIDWKNNAEILACLTVYYSLKQLLLALDGYVAKRKFMLPVVLKIFIIAFNILNFKSILICTSGNANLI